MSIRKESEKLEPYLIDIRRKIHENPELGFQEHETVKLIKTELEKLKIPYIDGIAITGIVATIEGGKGPGKTLLIRADMDALPLVEETKLPFKSKNEGVFHACGHDSHVSMLLGAANILKNRSSDFKGKIKLVFQPAEETSTVYDPKGSGGALPMIQEKPEEFKVDASLALHIFASEDKDFDLGKISIIDGPCMGSADELMVTIKGKGGHASKPHLAIDPVYIASQINVAVQGYISRTVNPVEPHVFTTGKIVGGFRHNIISETCSMECTIRTLNEEIREKLLQEIPLFINNIAKAYGGEADVQLIRGYPVGKNAKEMNIHIAKTVKELYGEQALVHKEQATLGAEDFFEFGFKNKIPIAMFWLGASNRKEGKIHYNHSNRFDFDEKAMPIGVSVLVGTALSFLND